MTTSPPGGPILGTLRSVDGKGIVRMEDRFDIGVQDLWSAITDPDRLAQWFGEVEDSFLTRASSVCVSPSGDRE